MEENSLDYADDEYTEKDSTELKIIRAVLANRVEQEIQKILESYKSIIDNLDNNKPIDKFRAAFTLHFGLKTLFDKMLVDTFYIGEKVANQIKQDLSLLLKVKRSINNPEEKKMCKYQRKNESSSKMMIKNSSIMMSHLLNNYSNGNNESIPSYLTNISIEEFVNPIDAYK